MEEILKTNRILLNKLKILIGIKEGIKEVMQAKKNGKELQSLSEFSDECKKLKLY